MTAIWDERIDDVTDQARDERYRRPGEPWCSNPNCLCNEPNPAACEQYLGPKGGVWKCPRCGALESAHVPTLCEDCGQACDPDDYRQHDGHGTDCPHGDPDCQLRVCDGVHADPTSHSVCETQAERDGRDAVEAAEAGRERWAEWHAEDGL